MTRKQFCCCAGAALVTAEPGAAAESPKLDAAQVRFAKLIGVLNAKLDPDVRKQVLQTLGRECAKQYSGLITKYAGNLQGFLDEGRKQWMESAELNQAAGELRIVDKSPTCSCPLVKQGATPPEFCDCTLGWQKEAYSAILGRPVEAQVEESILRGGKRCVFRISFQ